MNTAITKSQGSLMVLFDIDLKYMEKSHPSMKTIEISILFRAKFDLRILCNEL